MTKTQSKFNAATKRANRLQAVADEAKLEADALGKQWLAEVQAQIDPLTAVAKRDDVRPSFSGDAFGSWPSAVAEAE